MSSVESLLHTFASLTAAFILGGMIGFERQWRQRLAGLRTNTLVALGAATFVLFASLVDGDTSPTRVAAQIVSGIGFLGAGIIFKEGFNVRGLNTAATLWCSAAVGVMCGAGFYLHAAIAALFIISVNLFLRPLVHLIDRQPASGGEFGTRYAVSIVCMAMLKRMCGGCCCVILALSCIYRIWKAPILKTAIALRSMRCFVPIIIRIRCWSRL